MQFLEVINLDKQLLKNPNQIHNIYTMKKLTVNMVITLK